LCLGSKIGSKIFFREDNAATHARFNKTGTVMEQLLALGFSSHFLSEKSEDELKSLLSKHNRSKNPDANNANSKLGSSSSCLATRLLKNLF
jgi:hypothetical protein